MTVEQKPEDGTQGKPEEGAAATPKPETPEPKKLDLTQEQLDAIIADRIKRAQPKDYEDLKAKAARLDEIEEAKKTDEQKAKDAAAEADRKAAERIAVADARLRTAAILTEAAKQNAANPATVAKLLATEESIEVKDDGTVAGVEAAVKALLKDEPYLAKPTNGASGGEFGGADPKPLAARIAEAEAAGDWKTAMALKVNQGLNT